MEANGNSTCSDWLCSGGVNQRGIPHPPAARDFSLTTAIQSLPFSSQTIRKNH